MKYRAQGTTEAIQTAASPNTVHLLVPNHGRVFKSFLSTYLPDWEERERLLQGVTGQSALDHQRARKTGRLR